MRFSIRLRLTLLYGGVFLGLGLVLVGLNYLLARQGLEEGNPDLGQIASDVIESRGLPGGLVELVDESQFVEALREIDEDIRQSALDDLVWRSLVALGVTAVAAMALGWLVAWLSLRPMGRIVSTAHRISETNLHERIDLVGPSDEVKELADTFDDMIERLDAAFASQRRFSGDVSHELRTPLATMRGEAERLLARSDVGEEAAGLAELVRDQVDRSDRLIDSLLALSRATSTMIETREVDLADVVGEAVGALLVEADDLGVRVDLELDNAIVSGDRLLLGHLVRNLVDNAIRYNIDEGGRIDVSVGTEAKVVGLSVENTGESLSAEDARRMFDPFERLADTPGGHGLGTAIVNSVADAHGAAVSAVPLAGGGLSVTVTFPRSRGVTTLVGPS